MNWLNMRLIMRKITIVLSIFVLCSFSTLWGQSISVGPSIGVKMGTNSAPAMIERESEMKFNKMPDLGLMGFWQLGTAGNMGIGLNLAYYSYGYGIKTKSGDRYEFSYSYASISPFFDFHNITMGFTFGYPLKGKFVSDIPSENLRIMSEFNLGYMLPVINEDNSSLNIYINTGLMLSNVFYDFVQNDPMKGISPAVHPDIASEKFNPRIFSISFGINYLFNIYTPGVNPEDANPIGY